MNILPLCCILYIRLCILQDWCVFQFPRLHICWLLWLTWCYLKTCMFIHLEYAESHRRSGLIDCYPLVPVAVRTLHDSDCPSKWLCRFRKMIMLKLCHYILLLYIYFCLSVVSNIMIYHHAMVSISVLLSSWQFCCISGYCAGYNCHTADVEDMDQELFVSGVFLFVWGFFYFKHTDSDPCLYSGSFYQNPTL